MQLETLRKHVGNIVTLDLVNGKDFMTRIIDVSTLRVKCSKPRMFVPVPTPNGFEISILEYGYPLYKCDDEVWIDAAHVIMVHAPSSDQIEKYTQKTGSIMTVSPLQGLDLSGINGSS